MVVPIRLRGGKTLADTNPEIIQKAIDSGLLEPNELFQMNQSVETIRQ